MSQLLKLVPPDAVKIVLVLFLSFLMGLEREEHKGQTDHYAFGGIRTFPLIGLVGYAIALLSRDQIVPLALGFAVVGGFLMISFWHKLTVFNQAGITSEIAGLTTYLIGALVEREMFWIATAICVSGVLLLELKAALESITRRVPAVEVQTFTKFLLLSAVILPVLPNRDMSRFQINPFKAWLVVVAVSAVSYGSYVIQKVTTGGVILAAVLGGAYSSTVTTIALSRRAKAEPHPHLFAGATLIASGVMYLRLAVLLGVFNRALLAKLGPSFLALALLAIAGGWLWSRIPDESTSEISKTSHPANPLELKAAFLFALLFVVMLVATHYAVRYLGGAGVYSLAAVMGLSDVDPFIMGMTQAAATSTPLRIASGSILIAAASNNAIKGLYANSICDRKTGRQSLAFLAGLALLGLAPLLYI